MFLAFFEENLFFFISDAIAVQIGFTEKFW